jgi:hypothetical protein
MSLSSCSGTPATQAPLTQPVSTAPITTIAPPSPWVILETRVKRDKALDYSQLSISHSGVFALVIGESFTGETCCPGGDVRLLKWGSGAWSDVSARMPMLPMFDDGSPWPATSVTTYDYTQDGINDFLISYFDINRLNWSMGKILAIHRGEWQWLPFVPNSSTEVADTVASLSYNGVLSGRDYYSDGGSFTNTWRWDPSREIFESQGPPWGGDQ